MGRFETSLSFGVIPVKFAIPWGYPPCMFLVCIGHKFGILNSSPKDEEGSCLLGIGSVCLPMKFGIIEFA